MLRLRYHSNPEFGLTTKTWYWLPAIFRALFRFDLRSFSSSKRELASTQLESMMLSMQGDRATKSGFAREAQDKVCSLLNVFRIHFTSTFRRFDLSSLLSKTSCRFFLALFQLYCESARINVASHWNLCCKFENMLEGTFVFVFSL